LARQASEQYFTSAQFLAQLLRQVISRPQTTQILLGSAALLPLNPTTQTRISVNSTQRIVIVVGVGAVVSPSQLHRQVLVRVGDPLDAEKWRSMLNLQ
jgi:hypothetical protein